MASEQERTSAKRQHEETQPSDPDSDDDDMGPQLPGAGAGAGARAAPAKKRRVLPYERAYVDALPRGVRYSRSLMHKEPLAFVTATPTTDFFITSSVDGVVKFWKKVAHGIEFVKEYSAHEGAVRCVAVSADGRSFASAGDDGAVRVFDVVTFDLLSTIALPPGFLPATLCWVHRKSASVPLLAVADEAKPRLHVYDARGERDDPVRVVEGLHRAPVCALAFNDALDCIVSADVGGMVEYWRPSGNWDKPDNVFEYKSSTDLFDFKKSKAVPCCITVSPSGGRWAALSLPDRKLRIFEFATGKLCRTYDESLEVLGEVQQAGTAAQRLETVEFGRRMALEKEMEAEMAERPTRSRANVVFDESGHFVAYGSMVGVKVINTYTNQVVRVYGRDDHLRAVNLALYQGAPQRKGVTTLEMGASANPLLEQSEARDPILMATAVGKQRFYMFTNDEDAPRGAARDVQNEKPTTLGARKAAAAEAKKVAAAALASADAASTTAVMHTTYGDIHLRLFPDSAPRSVENFVTHARRGYYNGTIFHRVIRKFMIQGGDPLGDGTGGDSIWGTQFEDEFSTLKHDKPYTLSMANAGPNTNGSQFFITTEKTPWLDGKHTIFGRATQGFDVIHKIENARTRKADKPIEDITIVSIDIA